MTATRKVLQRYLNKYDTDGGTPHFTPQDDSLPSRRSRQYSSPSHLSLRLPGAGDSPALCTPSLPLTYKAVDLSPPAGRLTGEKEEGFEDMEDVDFSMILKLREERAAKRVPPVVQPDAEKPVAVEAKPAEEVKPVEMKEEVKPVEMKEEEKPAEMREEVKPTEVVKEEVKPAEAKEVKPTEPTPQPPVLVAAHSNENMESAEASQDSPTPTEEGKGGTPEGDAKEAKEGTRRRRRSHKTFTLAPPPPTSLPPTPTQPVTPTQPPQSVAAAQPPPQATEPAEAPSQATELEKAVFPLDEQIDKVTNLLHYSTGRVNAL